MTNNIGEFKGTTKEAIRDIRGDVKELKNEIKSLNRRWWITIVLLTALTLEKLPSIVSLVMAK